MKMLRLIFQQYRIPLAIIGILLVLDVGAMLYYRLYQVPHLEALQNALLAKVRGSAAGTTDRGEIYRRGVADLQSFNAMVPARRDFAKLLGDLYDAAKNNSLTVGNMTYKPEKDPSYLRYSMTLDVTGKYAGIKSFLGDLERLPRMIIVDGITLNATAPTKETITLRLQLSLYLQREG